MGGQQGKADNTASEWERAIAGKNIELHGTAPGNAFYARQRADPKSKADSHALVTPEDKRLFRIDIYKQHFTTRVKRQSYVNSFKDVQLEPSNR